MTSTLCYCKKCRDNNNTVTNTKQGYSINKGIVIFNSSFMGLGGYNLPRDICPECGETLANLNINTEELNIIKATTDDPSVLYALDKLKTDDPIEFALKLSQLKANATISKPSTSPQPTNVPKCPTCGSTNVKKIGSGKRWVSTGMFGLASSNLGKTMQCGSCGAKW